MLSNTPTLAARAGGFGRTRTIRSALKRIFVHNKRDHCVPVRIGDKEYHCCARCTAENILLLITLPLVFLLYHLGLLTRPGHGMHFLVALMFALPAILDWASAKLGLREGSNRMRLVTGGLLGAGIGYYIPPFEPECLLRILVIMFVFNVVQVPIRYHVAKRKGISFDLGIARRIRGLVRR